ncbi:Calcium-transporting ATPase 9, plasma membrane-type [Morella rubra]|uniref:P-type Ca(2+) transporter n=1 Tax=Morella rubra TaxID=262757 RepID=A0A6A1VCP7_9ROSI|nr:Calcium-transporting ATPase 9, plasma membrane-type [Morella rubra]
MWGPKLWCGDLGVSLGKALGRAEEDLEMPCVGPGGVDGITVAHGGKGGCSNSSGAHAEVAPELSVVVGSITSGSPALECAVGGQLLESACVGLLQIPSSLQPVSVGDLPTGSPAPELPSGGQLQGPEGMPLLTPEDLGVKEAQFSPGQELVEELGHLSLPKVTNFYSRKKSIDGVQLGIEVPVGVGDNGHAMTDCDNLVVRWGRSVYANIQKFIQFQLTVNAAALVINVVAAVSSGDVPLNAVQLLWVNLIMDTLGALALATEPPTDHLMHRSPVGRREPLITNIMWRNLFIQAFYQISVLLVLNFWGRSILHLNHYDRAHAVDVKNTMIFNAFVLCQIFNEFNARKPDEMNVFSGVTRNHLFMGIVGMTLVLQIIIIEFLGKFTSTVKLSWKQWLITIIIGLVRITCAREESFYKLSYGPELVPLYTSDSWPLAVIGKLIPVPETPLAKYLTAPIQRCRTARDAEGPSTCG